MKFKLKREENIREVILDEYEDGKVNVLIDDIAIIALKEGKLVLRKKWIKISGLEIEVIREEEDE
ncbi:MAG: hypothetical protein KGJ90_06450 [Patescibacteria group bacterium]|nr:hypothetical protein [Patescibacteria group bacterium]